MEIIQSKAQKRLFEERIDMLAGLVECTPAYMEKEIKRRLKRKPGAKRIKLIENIYVARIGKINKGAKKYSALFRSLTGPEIRAIPRQLYAFTMYIRAEIYPGVTFFIDGADRALEREIRAQSIIVDRKERRNKGNASGGTSRRIRKLRSQRKKEV